MRLLVNVRAASILWFMANVKLASDAPEGAGHISFANEDFDAPFETYDPAVIEFAENHDWFEVENADAPDPALVEAAEKAQAEAGDEDTTRVKASPADVAKTYEVTETEADSFKDRKEEVRSARN